MPCWPSCGKNRLSSHIRLRRPGEEEWQSLDAINWPALLNMVADAKATVADEEATKADTVGENDATAEVSITEESLRAEAAKAERLAQRVDIKQAVAAAQTSPLRVHLVPPILQCSHRPHLHGGATSPLAIRLSPTVQRLVYTCWLRLRLSPAWLA